MSIGYVYKEIKLISARKNYCHLMMIKYFSHADFLNIEPFTYCENFSILTIQILNSFNSNFKYPWYFKRRRVILIINHHLIMTDCMDRHVKADLNPNQITLTKNFCIFVLFPCFYITPDVDVILISVVYLHLHSFRAIH